MSQRRLFSPQVVESDAFLDMPLSSQALYFHLGMNADDDGFVGNAKRISRMVGANDDDLKILESKRFILTFNNGIIVLKHWKINNWIRPDRYKESKYIEEKKQLKVKENLAYTEKNDFGMSSGIHSGIPQVKLSQVKLSQVKRERGDKSPTPSQTAEEFFNNPEPTIQKLIEKGTDENLARQEIKKFISYWTELHKTGKKQRWEDEKFFEVGRRLGTWFSRSSQYVGNKKPKIVAI